MARFDPKMLVPALATDKGSAARSAKDVALANISKMKEQYGAGEGAEGKVNFKAVDGGRLAFTIRVSNTPLVLERTKVEDTEIEVREMTIPAANFSDALDYYADRIKAGEYDVQLTALSEKKEARTSKLRETRATKRVGSQAA
ncbi:MULTISPECIES: hypothetical protein [unclassified Sphingomonas]|uniref:hypothetical protein n=1 Tax=Sphingomonas sp. PvP015 TaxID=3156388 RepID=UPI00339757BB